MIVSIASGKGGTGKTTVSASLASIWDAPVVAVDLDVEEPNLHLFLRPELSPPEVVNIEIPVLNEAACSRCGACAEVCQFKAIAMLGDTPLVFPEMCHGCGGCLRVCPTEALSPGTRELGSLMRGRAGRIEFLMGRLRVGEAMSPPLMRAVKAALSALIAGAPRDAVVDAPPGVSCPAVSAVIDADIVLLVAEPTPFGVHDFRLAVEAFTPLGKPLAVAVNRAGIAPAEEAGLRTFCRGRRLPILATIPYDRAIAEGYARGRLVADLSPGLRATFTALRDGLRAHCAKEAVHA